MDLYNLVLSAKLIKGEGGGGGSNVVRGTFKTATEAGTGSFTIPYTGSGYPIALLAYVKGGPRNNTEGGNIDWYSSKNQYDGGAFLLLKNQTNTEPTYTGAGGNNMSTSTIIYKSSTSSSGAYKADTTAQAYSYQPSTIYAQNDTNAMRFMGDGVTVSYYVGDRTSTTIGLVRDTEFEYIAIYSE